jgi:hypothetical protein
MNRKHAEVQKKINFAERAAAMAALDCRKLLRVGMALAPRRAVQKE